MAVNSTHLPTESDIANVCDSDVELTVTESIDAAAAAGNDDDDDDGDDDGSDDTRLTGDK